jgi:hypothetical protein
MVYTNWESFEAWPMPYRIPLKNLWNNPIPDSPFVASRKISTHFA